MKIVNLKTYVMHANWRNYIFLELKTDDNGIIGYGEATLANNQYGVLGAIQDLRKYVIGRDPLDVEKVWRDMHRGPFWRGGAIFTTAISAIDQALWDIVGKVSKLPLYKIIGGKYRNSVRLYANGWFSGIGTPTQYASAAKRMVKQGFTALKFDPFGTSDMIIEPSMEENAYNIVKEVRSQIGTKVDIIIEAHGRFTPRIAIRLGKKLERFDPLWFEEPVPPEDLAGLERVADSVNIPIATGERLFTRFDYWNLLSSDIGVDIIQPDVCHVGGISELRKIAAIAEIKNILVAPHNSNGPVSTAASTHLLTAIPNGLILEYWVDIPWRSKLIKGGERISRGFITPLDRPGLGIQLDYGEIKKHPSKETHIDFFTQYRYH
jgi:galactonate dehydratase